jgi:MFS family permease
LRSALPRSGERRHDCEISAVNLWRNRDFTLFQIGRMVSMFGTQATGIAYPLVVLALTHSSAKAGIAGFASLIPYALFGLFAGVVADRVDRKRLMLTMDAARAANIATLGLLIVLTDIPWWLIPIAAFIEGSLGTLFTAAQAGVLRSLVPPAELPAAVGLQQARGSVVLLAGPPFGGALFGIGRAVPFLFDAASYVVGFTAVVLMRSRFSQLRERRPRNVRADIREGFDYLWSHPFIRASALIYGLGNFLMPGVLLTMVVVARRHGLSGGETGVLVAMLGAAALVGSLASPLFRRLLPVRGIMLLEFFTWIGCWVFVIHPSVYALLAIVVPFGIAAPVTDSVVDGYRVALTPEHLLSRVESVRSTIALVIAPLGPLVAGLLLAHTSERATVAVFACGGLVLLTWGLMSPGLRAAPRLDELGLSAQPD